MLNDAQQRSLLAGCRDIDRRLAEIESLLARGEHPSPFFTYDDDLSAAERRALRESCERLRGVMLACLRARNMSLEFERASLHWAIQVNTTALHVAVADMGPDRLRGYGPIEEEDRAAVEQVQQQLHGVVDEIADCLR